METEYGDYTIKYSETSDKFIVEIGDSTLSSSKLGDLKKRIDQLLKKEKKFDRIDVLCGSRWTRDEKLTKGQITSIAEKGRYSSDLEVWVTMNGKRTKRTLDHIYLDTDKNEKIHQEIIDISGQIEHLEGKIEDLYDSMEKPILTDDVS